MHQETDINEIINLNIQAEQFFTNRELDKAIALWKQVVGLDPQNASIYNNIAVALIENKNYQEAKRLLEGEIRKNPNDTTLHINMAAALEGLGDIKAAQSELESSLDIDPNNSRVRYQLYISKGMDPILADMKSKLKWKSKDELYLDFSQPEDNNANKGYGIFIGCTIDSDTRELIVHYSNGEDQRIPILPLGYIPASEDSISLDHRGEITNENAARDSLGHQEE